MYPYQSSPQLLYRRGRLPRHCGIDWDEPYRRFSAVPLLLLAGEGLLAAWAYWQLKAELLWAWPIVIVTAYFPYYGLWLAAGTSAAGLGVALLSLVYPERDVVGKALATLGLIAHSGVLAVVEYSMMRPR